MARENVKGLDIVPLEEVQLKAREILSIWLAALKKHEGKKWHIDEDSALHEALVTLAEEWDKLEVPPHTVVEFLFKLRKVILLAVRSGISAESGDVWQMLIDVQNTIDEMALTVYDALVELRNAMIKQQADAYQKVSIPLLRLREDTLLIPLVGVIDSEKAMQLMREALNTIRTWGVNKVILDIEAVSLIDTHVAGQLVKLNTAIKLMGAQMIISGMSPNVAETMVHLGIDLDIPTTAILQHAVEKFL